MTPFYACSMCRSLAQVMKILDFITSTMKILDFFMTFCNLCYFFHFFLNKFTVISDPYQKKSKIFTACITHMTSPLKNKYKNFHSYLVVKWQHTE